MIGKEFIERYLNVIANKITYKLDLTDVLFFYVSPMTKMLELRSGYFEDFYEAYQFADTLIDKYKNYDDISYVCYVNGRLTHKNNIEDIIYVEVSEELGRKL